MATPNKKKGLIEEMEEERQKERKESLDKLNQLADKYPKFKDKLSNMKNDGIIDDMSVKKLDKLYEKELKIATKKPSKKQIKKQIKKEEKEAGKGELLNKLHKLAETNQKFKDKLSNLINDGIVGDMSIKKRQELYDKELSHRPTSLITINKEDWSLAHSERIDQLGEKSIKNVKNMLLSKLKSIVPKKEKKEKLTEAETKTNDQLQNMIIKIKEEKLNKKYEKKPKKAEKEFKKFKDDLQKSREKIDIFLKHNKSNGVPLHHAIEFKASLNIIKQIYDKAKNAIKVKKTISKEIPLHRAAYLNSIDVIPFLINQYPEGAAVKSKAVKTPMDLADDRNQKQAVKLLEKITNEETKKIDDKKNAKDDEFKAKTKPDVIKKLRTFKKYKLKTKRKGLKKETLPDEHKLEEKSFDELKKLLDEAEKEKDDQKDIKKSKKFTDRFLNEKTRKKLQANRLKKIKTKKKRRKMRKGKGTKNAVTALKRYMGANESKSKKKKKDVKKKKTEKKAPEEIDPETLLNMKKLEKARELLKITGDVYGIVSSEYDQVEDYVLDWTKKKRMDLDDPIVNGFETKKDKKTKDRVIELLDDFDKFIANLKKGDSYSKLLEEMGNKAKNRLLSLMKGVSVPSSGMMKGDGIIPMIINVAQIIGVNALELFRFVARHGIDITKMIHVPVRYSIRKRRPRLIRRSLTNRVKNKLYNLQKYDNMKQTNNYDNDLQNAQEILRNLYKKGYRDAIQKMRKSNTGGNKTRKKKKRKRNKNRSFRK